MIKKRRKKVILLSVNKVCKPEELMRAELKSVKETVKDTRPVKIRTYGISLAKRYLEEKYEK